MTDIDLLQEALTHMEEKGKGLVISSDVLQMKGYDNPRDIVIKKNENDN